MTSDVARRSAPAGQPVGAGRAVHVAAHKGIALLVLAMGQLMVVLDGTIVNVALPSMARALHVANISDLQWVVTSYTLSFGGFLLLGGKLGDRFGRRRVFVAGTVVFAVASLIGGLSDSLMVLTVARIAQGVGGALLAPTALAMITMVFPAGRERDRAVGVFSALSAAGAAVGLILGGVLTEFASWRWVLFVNIPITVFAIIGALLFVPESRDRETRGFDVPGAMLVTAGLMALVFALVKGNDDGWGSGRTMGALILAAVLLVVFVVRQRIAARPLVPPRVFRSRGLTGADIGALLLNAGVFAVFFFVILWMQQVRGFTPLAAGLLFLPMTVIIGVGSGVGAQLLGKFGPRPLVIAGALIVAGGLAYLGLGLRATSSYPGMLLPALLVVGIGLGLSYVSLTSAAVSGVPGEDAGIAAALLNAAQQVGGAVGLAALTAVGAAAVSGGGKAGIVHGWDVAFLVGAGMLVISAIAMAALVRGNRPSPLTTNVPAP